MRPAQEDDRDALATFECSCGPWYEADVQDYVRQHALRRAIATPGVYRLLVVFDQDRLVACGAHHHEALVRDDSTVLLATRLQVLALTVDTQGSVLDNGTRFSNALLRTLIADAIATSPSVVMTAVVARDNLRSMALCERNGLRSQVRYDSRHVRLTGRITAA